MAVDVVSRAPEGLVRSASELRPGDYVVYPGQGVHRVSGFERMDVAGLHLEVVKLEREHDGATVIVPVQKVPSTGLRRVAGRELVEDAFHLLAAPGRHVELDWKERHREIGERLTTGGVLGIAEVVRELHDLAQIRPPPPKEREQYDLARHLLVQEMAASLAVPPGVAEDYIDYALTPPAGVKLPITPLPKPKPARWVPHRERHPSQPESLEEEFGPGEPALGEPGEEGPAAGVTAGAARKERRKKVSPPPTGKKRALKGERAAKTQPKKRPPPKPRAKRARRKTSAARRTSRANR